MHKTDHIRPLAQHTKLVGHTGSTEKKIYCTKKAVTSPKIPTGDTITGLIISARKRFHTVSIGEPASPVVTPADSLKRLR